MSERSRGFNRVMAVVFTLLSALFLAPIFVVLSNSFKGRFFISSAPFALPNAETFAGLQNYIDGFTSANFGRAFGYSLFITVFSVMAIVLFCSMTAWYIVRAKNKISSVLYYLFIFSMIVPFQMVMFTMSKMANILRLDNPLGIIVIYLGFGSGLSVFMFTGFIKSIPLEIEEAATIDGCNPVQIFFRVILPLLKPTAITVAILNAMWIWNDYLLPELLLGTEYATIPVAVQHALRGSYGAQNMGALMAMLILAIIPIIIFFLASQKHIIKGVVAGAVKG